MTIFVEHYEKNSPPLKKHDHPQAFHIIGNTPLIELVNQTELDAFPNVRVFAKLEMFNFGGSVSRLLGRKTILLKRTAQLNIKAVVISGTSCSFLFVSRSR